MTQKFLVLLHNKKNLECWYQKSEMELRDICLWVIKPSELGISTEVRWIEVKRTNRFLWRTKNFISAIFFYQIFPPSSFLWENRFVVMLSSPASRILFDSTAKNGDRVGHGFPLIKVGKMDILELPSSCTFISCSKVLRCDYRRWRRKLDGILINSLHNLYNQRFGSL